MRGSKEIYEDMIGRYNSLENHFKMLEIEYLYNEKRNTEIKTVKRRGRNT